jgi:uncharacterized membrane protein HdeD (DUF308 family)
MKQIFQSSIFRAVCSIVIGAMLIKYPGSTVMWITIAIGILFLLSGVIALITYIYACRTASEYTITDTSGNIISGGQPTFPIVGLGSIILGALLSFKPDVFITGLMYILGSLLILGALGQFLSLISARRYGSVPFFFWICPSLIFISGLYVMFQPMETAGIPMLILGWCCLLYGVAEILNAVKIYQLRKKIVSTTAEPEVLPEHPSES